MKLSGKVAIVSGGSGGIGSATVELLSSKDATVYSIDINGEIKNVIKGVHYISADLTKEHEVKNAVELIRDEVDVLFLNAGIMRRGTIFDSNEKDFELLFNTNLKASWMLLKYLKPKLQKNAVILQMSSGHALNPEPDPGVYTLTKKAAVALAEIVALTCPDFDVKVVYPGPVLTDLLLTGRNQKDIERISKIAAKPSFIAKKIIELIESNARVLIFNPETWDYSLK